jgi:hypothetical protein
VAIGDKSSCPIEKVLAGINSKENSILSSPEFTSVTEEFRAISIPCPKIVKINTKQIVRAIVEKRKL